MLETALLVGLTVEQFWDLTPAEFDIYVKTFQEKNDYELDKIVVLAYHIEAFHRTKKLKKLESYLRKKPKKKEKEQDLTALIESARARGLKTPFDKK